MRKIILLTLFMLIWVTTYANPAADLANLLNAIHTMDADFNQTIYDNRNKPIQKSTGHMAVQRPGKFRWQITKPIPQLIIANDAKLFIYDPDLEQVTIRSLKKAAGDTFKITHGTQANIQIQILAQCDIQ